jgi:hypothetical protein
MSIDNLKTVLRRVSDDPLGVSSVRRETNGRLTGIHPLVVAAVVTGPKETVGAAVLTLPQTPGRLAYVRRR